MNENVTQFRVIKGKAGELHLNQAIQLVTNLVVDRYVGGRALARIARELGYELDPKQARRIVMAARIVVRCVVPRKSPEPSGMTLDEAVEAASRWLETNGPRFMSWLEKKTGR